MPLQFGRSRPVAPPVTGADDFITEDGEELDDESGEALRTEQNG